MQSSKLRILLTGSSRAVNQIVKTIIDNNHAGECVSVGDNNFNCVIINDHLAPDNFRPPKEYGNVPVILITSNRHILANPVHHGLYAAMESSGGGGAQGFEQFKKQLLKALSSISGVNIGNVGTASSTAGHIGTAGIHARTASAADTIKPIDYESTPVKHASVSAHLKPDGVSTVDNAAHARQTSQDNIKPPGKVKVIAIGASTGGTDAIVEVVRDLPANTPPVVIVQHMPEGFTKMYADRLQRICKMSAKEAEDGDRLIPGRIIVARGSHQLRICKDTIGYYITSRPGEKVSGHCPSVDVLFESTAQCLGKDAVGVILTGMGRDGATGLGNMRRAGAYTIGQDEESCVVYGMPGVAFKEGAVVKQAPLSAICGILTGMI